MQRITERGLRKHLGERVRIEREGVVGNLSKWNYDLGIPVMQEGALIGILEEDEPGFYVRMFKTYWNEIGLQIDKSSFLDEPYMLKEMDCISFKRGGYLVRLRKEK